MYSTLTIILRYVNSVTLFNCSVSIRTCPYSKMSSIARLHIPLYILNESTFRTIIYTCLITPISL